MIKNILSWLCDSPVEEQEKIMGEERKLEEKKDEIDESIERGRMSADRLRHTTNRQVAEAHIAIATIRGLLVLLQDKDDRS